MKTLVSEAGKGSSYQCSDNRVAAGPSLGNSALWVNIKGTGAVDRVFSTYIGQCVIGSIRIQYAGAGGPLVRRANHAPPVPTGQGFVPLHQEAPGSFQIATACQHHRFILPGALHVRETVFVPLGAIDDELGDPPFVYQAVRVENRSRRTNSLRVTAFARMRGDTAANIETHYDDALKALVATNAGTAGLIRTFACTASDARHGVTCDFGSAYDPSNAPTLDGDVGACGDVIACLQYDFAVAPGEFARFAFVSGVFVSSEELEKQYPRRETAEDALGHTEAYLREFVRTAEVLTPDRQINLGALWSKVNMRRVVTRYPTGRAFTNEPGVSSNVVARDAAWFSYGCDHLIPSSSRALLEAFAQRQYPSGKIPEYYNALDGRVEDYGLNINDDTPLFIMAVNHHYRSSGNEPWLTGIMPAVERAADYIIAQMDRRGLVVCTAQDPRGDVWGIASWRNIIPGYSITGAVTEINALCAAALRAAAHLVENLNGKPSERKRFHAAYERIREAMETHLRNPENGLYYLNVDVDGTTHSDVTGDELFPVMCRVCDDETGYRIITRLNSPDFWTPAGLRTVSRDDPLYDPSSLEARGLLGGVWPALTWLYAFAAARFHPEFMVRALRSSFAHYAADPARNNTVPGEFSEWFDGETLVNRGMRLSPWEPPRFLWAAIEGVCGFSLRPGAPSIQPLVPATWRWVGVRRVPYHGREITYFAVRQKGEMHVYATCAVESELEAETFEADATDAIAVLSHSAAPIALRRGSELLVMVGNVGAQTASAPMDLSRAVKQDRRYDFRVYNSERDDWIDGATLQGSDIASIAVSIELHGYRLIHLRELD